MRLGYIVHKDVHKLCACLVVAKEDPTVFLDPVAPVVATKDTVQSTLDNHSFKLAHTELMLLYKKRKLIVDGFNMALRALNQMANSLIVLAESLLAICSVT
jgi:hypothetical protein